MNSAVFWMKFLCHDVMIRFILAQIHKIKLIQVPTLIQDVVLSPIQDVVLTPIQDVGTGLVPVHFLLSRTVPAQLGQKIFPKRRRACPFLFSLDSHKGCPYINNTILCISLIIIFLSCTSKVIKPTIPKDLPPKEIPKFSFNQLKNQKSFEFNLHFKTDTPAQLEAEFDGSVILPNQEERIGTWHRMAEKTSIHIKGNGNSQYEKKAGKWEIHPRGEESNILIQIERIMLFSKFELKSRDSRQTIFSFKPNLIFLDPTLTKPMKGILIINSSSLLPEKIQVSDSLRAAFWEIRLFNYNRKSKISFPFTPKVSIQLTAESRFDNKTKTILIDRFQQLGFQSKTKTYSSNWGPILEFQLEKDIPETQLNLITSQGTIKIYSGEWLESKTVESDTGLKYFQFKPFQLHELIFTNQDIEQAGTNFTRGPEPLLEILLKPTIKSKLHEYFQKANLVIFMLLDDAIIGYNRLAKNQENDKLTFKGIGDILKVTTIATIINSGPIKPDLKFLSKNKF